MKHVMQTHNHTPLFPPLSSPCVRLDLADSMLMEDWELHGDMLDL